MRGIRLDGQRLFLKYSCSTERYRLLKYREVGASLRRVSSKTQLVGGLMHSRMNRPSLSRSSVSLGGDQKRTHGYSSAFPSVKVQGPRRMGESPETAFKT